jgi:hypothetical protein
MPRDVLSEDVYFGYEWMNPRSDEATVAMSRKYWYVQSRYNASATGSPSTKDKKMMSLRIYPDRYNLTTPEYIAGPTSPLSQLPPMSSKVRCMVVCNAMTGEERAGQEQGD